MLLQINGKIFYNKSNLFRNDVSSVLSKFSKFQISNENNENKENIVFYPTFEGRYDSNAKSSCSNVVYPSFEELNEKEAVNNSNKFNELVNDPFAQFF